MRAASELIQCSKLLLQTMRIVIIPLPRDDKRMETAPPRLSAQRRQLPERTRADVLLGAAKELIIEHGGRDYHLRVTQQGKLILTA